MKSEPKRFRLEEFELEEKYLSRKHSSGLILERIENGKYYFSEGEGALYVYKTDFNKDDKNELDYINSIEDLGWEYICRSRDNYYFRRKEEDNLDETKFLSNKEKYQIYHNRIKKHIFEFIPIYIITVITASILIYNLIESKITSFIVVVITDIIITLAWMLVVLDGTSTMAKMKILIENEKE